MSTDHIIGPALPSIAKKQTDNIGIVIGPTLIKNECETEKPPQDTPEKKNAPASSSYGPALPPNLVKSNVQNDETNTTTSSSDYSPALPPGYTTSGNNYDSEDDDDVYGPLLPEMAQNSSVHRALEERALELRLRGGLDDNKDTKQDREEWMLELPKVGCGGLGTRHFRKNNRPDFSDRSSWTDTPQSKKVKAEGKKEDNASSLREEAKLQEIKERDEEQRIIAEEHKKKHGKKKKSESLLKSHQKKLKKKKKEKEKEAKAQGLSSTRRPFSREVDLKVNMFDEAQKKSILKKAQHLDDRFSKGQSKYL